MECWVVLLGIGVWIVYYMVMCVLSYFDVFFVVDLILCCVVVLGVDEFSMCVLE